MSDHLVSERSQADRTAPPAPLVQGHALSKFFSVRHGMFGKQRLVRAVQDASIDIGTGQTVGLVGESGSGKTTLGRLLLRLLEPSFGRIWFDGRDITHYHERDLRALRRQMQLLFQDAPASLDARMRVSDIVAEPLRIHAEEATDAETLQRVSELLGSVGLSARMLGRRPPELSFGECQRLCLARALALTPRFIVCDEPVAGLDLLEQAQIADLLLSLQERRGISYLFISHDLRLVSRLSRTVYVMYAGHIVERGDTALLRQHACHPYTRSLVNAVPELDPKRRRLRVLLEGKPPSPFAPIEGCAFHPRCPRAEPGLCVREVPPLTEIASGHEVACWHPYT
jgi:peptide/nickel transport system ATP-binding protein